MVGRGAIGVVGVGAIEIGDSVGGAVGGTDVDGIEVGAIVDDVSGVVLGETVGTIVEIGEITHDWQEVQELEDGLQHELQDASQLWQTPFELLY
jgi:hypothetical protein